MVELRSETPPQNIPPPPPRYWAFCSAIHVFIRKLGATESTWEGKESRRACRAKRERGREGEEKYFCFQSKSEQILLSFVFYLLNTLHSSAARQSSSWPASSLPRLDSSSFWLATLLQVRDVAGCWKEGGGREGSKVRQLGTEWVSCDEGVLIDYKDDLCCAVKIYYGASHALYIHYVCVATHMIYCTDVCVEKHRTSWELMSIRVCVFSTSASNFKVCRHSLKTVTLHVLLPAPNQSVYQYY